MYDLLTNTRYGLGSYILTPAERTEAEAKAGDQFEGTTDVASNLDVYSFQQASAYCGGLVSDNAGGTEPRFSCNVLINSQGDAYKLIQQLCSVFRAMPFWEQAGLRWRMIDLKTSLTSSTSRTSRKRASVIQAQA